MEPKAGYKTTEFWISSFVLLLGLVVFVVDSLQLGGSVTGQIIAGLVSLAGVLGYTVPRAGLKKQALAAKALESLDKSKDPS